MTVGETCPEPLTPPSCGAALPATSVAKGGAHLGFLDGIRGGAAFWVLLAHCMIWTRWFGIPLPSAKLAVDVFMVVSGYLMFYQCSIRESTEPAGARNSALAFWTRRFFRIAPLYFLVLAVVFAFGEPFCHGYSILREANADGWRGDTIYDPARIEYTPVNFLLHLTFVFGLLPQFAFSTFLPDWSISLEMQFYAVFPLVFWLFRRRGVILGAALIWCLAIAVRKTLSLSWPEVVFPEPSFLPLKMPVFLVGALLASSAIGFKETPVDSVMQLLGAMVLAARESMCIVLLAAAMFALSVNLGTAGERWLMPARELGSRILGNRFCRFLADASYSVYLIHGLFLSFLGGWLFSQPWFVVLAPVVRFLIVLVVVTVGSYSLGWGLHLFIERPGIELGRKVVRRWRRATVTPSIRGAGTPVG